MIHLSVNINKIATLRNSRGGNIPSLPHFCRIALDAGASGITVHPRSDERHIRKSDLPEIKNFLKQYNKEQSEYREFNMEGEASERFAELVLSCKPDQATLVPVRPGEITSDHGFQLKQDWQMLKKYVDRFHKEKIRVSLFVETDPENLRWVAKTGADRVEFYTGPFAEAFDSSYEEGIRSYQKYEEAARVAESEGLEVNAGHDLDHRNLAVFRGLPGLREVSIGHRLTSYALEVGYSKAIGEYLEILNPKNGPS